VQNGPKILANFLELKDLGTTWGDVLPRGGFAQRMIIISDGIQGEYDMTSLSKVLDDILLETSARIFYVCVREGMNDLFKAFDVSGGGKAVQVTDITRVGFEMCKIINESQAPWVSQFNIEFYEESASPLKDGNVQFHLSKSIYSKKFGSVRNLFDPIEIFTGIDKRGGLTQVKIKFSAQYGGDNIGADSEMIVLKDPNSKDGILQAIYKEYIAMLKAQAEPKTVNLVGSAQAVVKDGVMSYEFVLKFNGKTITTSYFTPETDVATMKNTFTSLCGIKPEEVNFFTEGEDGKQQNDINNMAGSLKDNQQALGHTIFVKSKNPPAEVKDADATLVAKRKNNKWVVDDALLKVCGLNKNAWEAILKGIEAKSASDFGGEFDGGIAGPKADCVFSMYVMFFLKTKFKKKLDTFKGHFANAGKEIKKEVKTYDDVNFQKKFEVLLAEDE